MIGGVQSQTGAELASVEVVLGQGLVCPARYHSIPDIDVSPYTTIVRHVTEYIDGVIYSCGGRHGESDLETGGKFTT